VEDKISVAELDVTSDASTIKCFDEIFKKEGRFDFLINNAGFSVLGGLETLSLEDCQKQLETNLLGVVRCCKQVLPVMRKQKSGRIIGVSSVGGVVGTPFNDIYCASKFAMEGLFESMAALYLSFGVYCILIEPGAIVTKFIETASKNIPTINDPELEEYKKQYFAKMLSNFTDTTMSQTGEQVAEVIKTSMEDVNPKFRYQTNPKYQRLFSKLTDPSGVTDRDATFKRYFQK